jgi:hypothetical protein
LSSIASDESPALLHIIHDAWFTRLWVVQEAALAPASVCHRGDKEILLLDVLRIVAWLEYKWYSLPHNVTLSVSRRHKEIFDLVDKQHGFYGRLPRPPIYLRLLSSLKDFQTRDHRDHVFATLGMWQQQSGSTQLDGLLKPDYSLDVCSVFQNATRYAIHQSDDLEY